LWGFDPNPVDDVAHALHPQAWSLGEWFARWLDGRLLQPWSVQDPNGGTWRGATDEEYAEALADL
jgi:hypothetical protein